ncbi:galactosylceramide sulfotransferase-like [Ornithodoros turicata]|uniref:galactosylceramide sulfotransferase-like n=1 Tax=Ornithodoros turicata TaxID=34597 RepID=UPI0031398664
MLRKLKKLRVLLIVAGLTTMYSYQFLSSGERSWKCVARKNVVFLKTHKCASSSIFNLLMRRALEKDLLVAVPKKPPYSHMGYPLHFDPERDMMDFASRGMRPNIMALHMRFNYTAVRQVMPADTVYITIMRNPSDLFLSLFYYFKLYDVYNVNASQFLYEPFLLDVVRNSRVHKSLGFNQMAFDLGAEQHHLENGTVIDSLVRAVDSQFHLVMIAERFLESLVLLKELLCWETDDVITFRQNDMRRKKTPLPRSAAKTLKRSNVADEALYAYFVRKFDLRVEAFGKERMREEVMMLESRLKFWYKRCVHFDYRTRDSQVYEYYMKRQNASTERVMCRRLSLPEQSFTEELRQQALKRLGVIPKIVA